MILALILVLSLLYATFKASEDCITIQVDDSGRKKLLVALSIILALSMIQIFFGTQVGESIDVLENAEQVIPRSQWID